MARRSKLSLVLGIVLFLSFKTIPFAQQSIATSAVVPRLIAFGGIIRDGKGQPLSGVVGLIFSIYKDEQSGVPLWTENQNAQVDESGRYSVLLGATQVTGLPMDLFTSSEQRWLGVQTQLPGETEQPRVLLVSVPYALRAADAESLGGKPVSAFVLAPDNTNAPTSQSGPSSTVTPKTTAFASTGGTPGQISKFAADGTSLINSVITESSGQVGIGTTNPGSLLDVNGGIRMVSAGGRFDIMKNLTDSSSRRNWGLNTEWSNLGDFSVLESIDNVSFPSVPRVTIDRTGNVGIGAAIPSQKLTILGASPQIGWGQTSVSNHLGTDQGGNLELGAAGTAVNPVTHGTPYIDFHYGNGLAKDYDVRIVNSASGRLDVISDGTQQLTVTGTGVGVNTIPQQTQAQLDVAASGDNQIAIRGVSTQFTVGPIGILGETVSAEGYGVYSRGNAFVQGNLSVTGQLNVTGTKNFKIDHPLDPANKYLVHAAVESSEAMNLYTGTAALDGQGQAWVALPEWFETLNSDFRYQLTSIGMPGPNLYIAEKIHNGGFKIAGGAPGAEVSWQITGTRQDPYAKAHPIVVEQEKPENERGLYIHPEVYGQPEEKAIDYANKSAITPAESKPTSVTSR